jgi:glycosyltransferase involved in cell wall biosynthesis
VDTCQALRRHGVQAEIATTNANGETNFVIPEVSPVLIEGIPTYLFERQHPWRYAFSWPLTRWLKKHVRDYDLLHLHAVFVYAIAPAAYYARRYGLPYIVLPHGVLDPWALRKSRLRKRAYFALLEKRNLDRAAAIHFTAEEEYRRALATGIRARTFVLPYIVNLEESRHPSPRVTLRERRPELQGKTLVLFLSRIDPKKGLDLLIPALGQLASQREDFAFLLAGTGEESYEEQVSRMLHDAGLAPRTVRLGFVQGADKAAVLRDADLFVLPSYQENFGIAVVEAMAAGLPVVISDRVNIHAEVFRAKAGLVVSQDATELARAIATLLDSPVLRETMGKEGQRLVEERFSRDRVAKQLIEVYEDILRGIQRSRAWVDPTT